MSSKPNLPAWSLHFLLVAVLGFLHGVAVAMAPQSFTFKELPECATKRHPDPSEVSLQSKRVGNQLVVLVEAPMSCSSQVTPSVFFGHSKKYVSIALEVQQQPSSSSGPVAACVCRRRFEVTLLKPISRGTVIYLVLEGVARAHKSAA